MLQTIEDGVSLFTASGAVPFQLAPLLPNTNCSSLPALLLQPPGLVGDKSDSWGKISPPRIIKVKVSLDVLTVGGSNYNKE